MAYPKTNVKANFPEMERDVIREVQVLPVMTIVGMTVIFYLVGLIV